MEYDVGSRGVSAYVAPAYDISPSAPVRIRAGGRILQTTLYTLQQFPHSQLALFFSEPYPLYDPLQQVHVLPPQVASGDVFALILDRLRNVDASDIMPVQHAGARVMGDRASPSRQRAALEHAQSQRWAPPRSHAERGEIIAACAMLGLPLPPPPPPLSALMQRHGRTRAAFDEAAASPSRTRRTFGAAALVHEGFRDSSDSSSSDDDLTIPQGDGGAVMGTHHEASDDPAAAFKFVSSVVAVPPLEHSTEKRAPPTAAEIASDPTLAQTAPWGANRIIPIGVHALGHHGLRVMGEGRGDAEWHSPAPGLRAPRGYFGAPSAAQSGVSSFPRPGAGVVIGPRGAAAAAQARAQGNEYAQAQQRMLAPQPTQGAPQYAADTHVLMSGRVGRTELLQLVAHESPGHFMGQQHGRRTTLDAVLDMTTEPPDADGFAAMALLRAAVAPEPAPQQLTPHEVLAAAPLLDPVWPASTLSVGGAEPAAVSSVPERPSSVTGVATNDVLAPATGDVLSAATSRGPSQASALLGPGALSSGSAGRARSPAGLTSSRGPSQAAALLAASGAHMSSGSAGRAQSPVGAVSQPSRGPSAELFSKGIHRTASPHGLSATGPRAASFSQLRSASGAGH